jgi:hypothetical protein
MHAPLSGDKDSGKAVQTMQWPGTVGSLGCVDPKTLIRVESIGLEELRTRKQLGNAESLDTLQQIYIFYSFIEIVSVVPYGTGFRVHCPGRYRIK